MPCRGQSKLIMKIAYLSSYLGAEFLAKYGKGKRFALSGPLKSRGIARAMLSAGNEVTVFSPGVTTCDALIPSFSEVEEYPEGRLTIKYCNIVSKHRCAPVNAVRIARLLRSEAKDYDVFVYYNVELSAALAIRAFKNKIKVIEYEDNIFNKALEGDRNAFEGIKRRLYNYLMKHTDGVMAVCLGLKDILKHSVLTPGILNEDVLDNVSSRVNDLEREKPVHIFLTGGIHYSKGGDLLVKSMSFLKTPCVVTVFGNCDLNDSMKSLIEAVPSIHRFEFKGYLPHEELIKTLDKEADILINTTRSMHVGAQSAGFPFKMMEYAAIGRPIVSSEIGKLDEDFNSLVTYYDGEDPKAIAEAIEQVIADYEGKVQNALCLQKRVLSEYTIKGTGDKLEHFFKTLKDEEC